MWPQNHHWCSLLSGRQEVTAPAVSLALPHGSAGVARRKSGLHLDVLPMPMATLWCLEAILGYREKSVSKIKNALVSAFLTVCLLSRVICFIREWAQHSVPRYAYRGCETSSFTLKQGIVQDLGCQM